MERGIRAEKWRWKEEWGQRDWKGTKRDGWREAGHQTETGGENEALG